MMKTQKVNVIRKTVRIAWCALANVLCLNAALAAQDRLTLQDKDVVLQTTNVVDVIAVQCRDLARLYRDGVKVAECHPDTSGKVVFPRVGLNRGVTLIRVEAGEETDELSWRFGVTEGVPAGMTTRKFENPRVKWFEDARFGLFVHWGIYSIPGKGEWTYAEDKYAPGEYEAFAKQFNPMDYDPREWARLAKAAGMKYVVFTTRHHDGFCMFDSHFTDYKITNTPYGKDVLTMLCEAFRAEGLKIGFYHSLPDWTNGGYVDPETPTCIQTGKCRPYDVTKHAAYRKLVWDHVNQLTTEYGKVDLMFFDYTSKFKNDIDYFARDELMALCRRNQPDIIINDRLAYFKDGAAPDFDYYTPETTVPSASPVVRGTERTWETCATMNDSWGYRAADKNFKSVETLVSGLVGCVSRNGNLLLNVGPDEKGRIPPESVERLKGLADWYRVNGESVTGCGASALTPPYGCVYTQKGNTLYLHVNVVPMGDLILPGLLGKIGRMTLLRTGEAVSPVSFWGFETLRPDDCRIRATGLRVGDVIKIDVRGDGVRG